MTLPVLEQSARAASGSQVTCPYLGTYEDPETWYQFPDSGNFCYRSKPRGQVQNQYQRLYCLSPNYINCRLFVENWNKPLPKDIKYHHETRLRPLAFSIFAVVVLAAIGYALYLFLIQ
jgi:hypothetical protein